MILALRPSSFPLNHLLKQHQVNHFRLGLPEASLPLCPRCGASSSGSLSIVGCCAVGLDLLSPPDTFTCHSRNLHKGQFFQSSPSGNKRRTGRQVNEELSYDSLEPRPPRQCHCLWLPCEMLVDYNQSISHSGHLSHLRNHGAVPFFSTKQGQQQSKIPKAKEAKAICFGIFLL